MAFIDSVDHSFASITVTDSQVPAEEFLLSVESLLVLLGKMGTAFGVVVRDMQGNVNTLRSATTPQSTLQQVSSSKTMPALLWLGRALLFTSTSLRRSLENPSEELSASFAAGYKTTLSAHHSFLIRPVFSLAMAACPTRRAFYDMVGDQDKFNVWLTALESQVQIIVGITGK